MELQEALTQISVIRRTLDRRAVFRGYGARPMAASAVIAVAAAAGQAMWIPTPGDALGDYLRLWVAAAAAGFLISLFDVWRRYRHSPLSLWREDAWLALAQFLPCMGAGALVTLAIAKSAPDAAWLLPGLWSVLFGLGLFASSRNLPRAMLLVAAWYVSAGCVVMIEFRGASALSPWAMALVFGLGQAGAAAVLAIDERRTPGDADESVDEEVRP
jgi:hypothetical protein